MKTKLHVVPISILALALAACSEVATQNNDTAIFPAQFTLTNTSELSFEDVPLTLSYAQMAELVPNLSAINTIELMARDITLVHQLDDLDQDGKWDEIAFLIDVPAKSELTVNVLIKSNTQNNASPPISRTNIRFGKFSNDEKSQARESNELSRQSLDLPEDYSRQYQMEGPAWENDLIGFRLYFDERNGFDIFGKTNSNMVLDNVGLAENYHEMQDWGMDILKVGRSLGAGALAFVNNEVGSERIKLQAVSGAKQTRAKIIVEGPVRSILDVYYHDLPMANERVNLRQRISIWAGQQHYSGELILDNTQQSTQIAVGIVNLHEATPVHKQQNKVSILASYANQAEQSTFLGMAVVADASSHLGFDSVAARDEGIEHSFISVFELLPNQALNYDFYAVWQPRMSNIDSEEKFLNLLERDQIRKRALSISF
jgi:ureidoglycolate hydrolase